jgi:hypothetical protein
VRQQRQRRQRQQQQHEQQSYEEQQQQQEQQQPADSTEAQQLGLPVGQGPAGSAGRQGSGSTRQEGWFGFGMLNPLHWFRGGSN